MPLQALPMLIRSDPPSASGSQFWFSRLGTIIRSGFDWVIPWASFGIGGGYTFVTIRVDKSRNEASPAEN